MAHPVDSPTHHSCPRLSKSEWCFLLPSLQKAASTASYQKAPFLTCLRNCTGTVQKHCLQVGCHISHQDSSARCKAVYVMQDLLALFRSEKHNRTDTSHHDMQLISKAVLLMAENFDNRSPVHALHSLHIIFVSRRIHQQHPASWPLTGERMHAHMSRLLCLFTFLVVGSDEYTDYEWATRQRSTWCL